MLTEFIRAAMRRASYEKLDDGTYFGEIPEFQGLWASGDSLELCRADLREALEDWLVVGLRLGHSIPVLDDIDLNVTTAA